MAHESELMRSPTTILSELNIYTEEELAGALGVTVSTLEHWRTTNKGPAFVRPSGKRVFYRRHDVVRWLDHGAVQRA